MSLKLYMDVHVQGAVSRALRLRGADVLTAQMDGAETVEDSLLLDQATDLDRVLFTQDRDFLALAAHRQRAGVHFPGIIFSQQGDVPIGRIIEDLSVIALAGLPEDLANRVIWLHL